MPGNVVLQYHVQPGTHLQILIACNAAATAEDMVVLTLYKSMIDSCLNLYILYLPQFSMLSCYSDVYCS